MSDAPKGLGPDDRPVNTANLLREKRTLSAPLTEESVRAVTNRSSRRSFLVAAGAVVVGGLGLRWLLNPAREGIFVRMLGFNEKLGRKIFHRSSLAPEFPRELARMPRVNGTEGLSDEFDPNLWQLQVTGVAGAEAAPRFARDLSYTGEVDSDIDGKFPATPVAGLLLTLDDIKSLPRVEQTTELKCIEGWTTVVNWTGARFSDFAAKFVPHAAGPNGLPPYVSLVTPDRGYYVGWDTASLLHPQTLLCYEMNGKPLSLPHGGPLRLVTTAKYGIKQIKRIGRIAFTAERPPDYWAEQGYDWYSGL